MKIKTELGELDKAVTKNEEVKVDGEIQNLIGKKCEFLVRTKIVRDYHDVGEVVYQIGPMLFLHNGRCYHYKFVTRVLDC